MFDEKIFVKQLDEILAEWKAALSNVVISRDEILAFSSAEKSAYHFGSGIVCMYYFQGEYVHFSFVLKDRAAFSELFAFIDSEQFTEYHKTVEFIGRDSDMQEYIEIMQGNGFEKYQHYQMWELNTQKKTSPFRYKDIAPLYEDITVCRAENENAAEIATVLQEAFSDEVARFPSAQKIAEMIQNNEIICAKVNGCIIAVYLYEMVSRSACYLHMLACRRKYNGSGAGILLLSYILSEYSDILFFRAWVEEKNHDSNRIIDSFGFEKNDFLKYYVMRKGV